MMLRSGVLTLPRAYPALEWGLRWAERHGFATNTLDLQPGDEAGIKDATIELAGALVIGGAPGNPSTLTIAASDADGSGFRGTLGSNASDRSGSVATDGGRLACIVSRP